MNIVKEQLDDLNAVLKITLEPVDYEHKVDATIKNIQKRAQVPGFRPGKVPAGMVKKMYGKNVLVDELNKLLNDSIYQYINDSKIEILGSPLPKYDQGAIDWDTQKQFEFSYDLGLAPKFDVEVSSKNKYTYYTVQISDDILNKEIDYLLRNHGSVANPEVTEAGDFLVIDIVELEPTGEIKPGGIFKTTTIVSDRIKDAETQQKFVGLKKDDKIVVDIQKLTDSAVDRAAMLGIDKAAAEILQANFQITIKTITRLKKAEVNEELFSKVYPNQGITTEQDFRNKLREDLAKTFVSDSKRKFFNDVSDDLTNKININLPDSFLKRWIGTVNEKPVTTEQIDNEYPQYAKSLKWQLIENKIIKDHSLTVTVDEAKEYAKTLINNFRVSRYNAPPLEGEELNKQVEQLLADEKEGKRVYDNLYRDKITDLFLTTFTVENKEMPYNEFFNVKE